MGTIKQRRQTCSCVTSKVRVSQPRSPLPSRSPGASVVSLGLVTGTYIYLTSAPSPSDSCVVGIWGWGYELPLVSKVPDNKNFVTLSEIQGDYEAFMFSVVECDSHWC